MKEEYARKGIEPTPTPFADVCKRLEEAARHHADTSADFERYVLSIARPHHAAIGISVPMMSALRLRGCENTMYLPHGALRIVVQTRMTTLMGGHASEHVAMLVWRWREDGRWVLKPEQTRSPSASDESSE